MAKSTQKSLELEKLIRRSEAARVQIGQAQQQLRQKLDIPLRIKDSLMGSPMKWLGGSMVAGFVGSFLLRPRKSTFMGSVIGGRRRGWFLGLLMMLFSLAKPTLKIYAAKLLKDYLKNQLSRRAAGRYVDDRRGPY